jgi:uncharacterized protein
MELEITTQVVLIGAVLGLILGAVANGTNFCTMGAVSDWVNMGDMRRLRSWFLAIAVAIIGVVWFESGSLIDMTGSRVPYRSSTFFWPRYILGGLMFGVGMTLASGCANKNLVRIGGGNLKSIIVAIIVAMAAYAMTRTDFYGLVFHSWMAPISPDLATLDIADQSLGTVLGSIAGLENPASLNLYLGMVLALGLLLVIFKSKDFRTSSESVIAGASIGILTMIGWYVTAGSMGQEWVEVTEFMEIPPPGVGPQSFTFVNPMGETLVFLKGGGDINLLTFGMATMFGVIIGSFLYAIISRSFRIEWFANIRDVVNHMIGAVLMGIGGVLALGCTLGQGVTGVSTLALGSFLALGSIILGSALTMKVQYYKLVYEAEASFGKALVTGLVDLRLLPQRMRKLEAI